VPTHELWHRLMRDELGFERYAAHGGDLGAGVSSRLGQAHPESVLGVHVMAIGMPSDFDSDDFLLAQASLYWFTNAISTSLRPYYENGKVVGPVSYVSVPTAVALFPADLDQPPRSWAERTHNVVRYTTMPRGGHFAAHEEPELLAADIVDFLRTLRGDQGLDF